MARPHIHKARLRGASLGGPRSGGVGKALPHSVRGSGSDGSRPSAPQHAGKRAPLMPSLPPSGQPEPLEPTSTAAGRCEEAEDGSSDPSPAAAAKQRASRRISGRVREAEARQAHESFAKLAEEAEAKQAADLKMEAAVGEGSSHHNELAADEEEEREEDASVLLASGPGFKLARGHEPPCFRIWITLPLPADAADISGKPANKFMNRSQLHKGVFCLMLCGTVCLWHTPVGQLHLMPVASPATAVRCARRHITVTQHAPAGSPAPTASACRRRRRCAATTWYCLRRLTSSNPHTALCRHRGCCTFKPTFGAGAAADAAVEVLDPT
jgi:hypothetical protein